MHFTTSKEDGEATRLLLEHGANPNVKDSKGNSPLHTICSQKDIQTAICILENNGRLLENKKKERPDLTKLFFDQDEEDVKKMMQAISQSKHRVEILNELLRKEHLLFRLVEEDKPEILSIVLTNLREAEQEKYVNLVRNEKDGNTCLHIATLINKSLKCTSVLLEARAKLETNAANYLPNIEDFFTEENDNQITSALVDGLVERLKSNQGDQERALELLIPDKRNRKIHFTKASGTNWALMAQWEGRYGEMVDFSKVVLIPWA